MNRFDVVYLGIVAVAFVAMLVEWFTTVKEERRPSRITTTPMERVEYADAREAAVGPEVPPLHEYPFRVAPYYPLDPDPTEQIELDHTAPIEVAAMLGTTYESERAQLP